MKQRFLTALLALVLLLSAGCKKSPDSETDPTAEPTIPATEPISTETSLDSLRQAVAETNQLFAVAYFGYHYSENLGLPVDPFETMKEYAPVLCEQMPFLLEITEDRVVGKEGDLFCIIPLDEDAAVTASRGYWDDENEQHTYDDMIYSCQSGEPILLFCNADGWEPDTQVYISGPSGEVFWCAGTDRNGFALQGDFYDISPYAELLKAEQQWLKDCGWTLPTKDQLIGTAWSSSLYLEDGTEYTYEMSIDNDFLAARWNEGENHVYHDAAWELTYEDETAVLSIDFGQMAGVLRYNLLYEESYGELYVSLDVTQEDFPVGGEPMSRYMTMTSMPTPLEMVGTWELGWTEVDGYINGAELGSQIIEITTDYQGHYQISYTNNEFPKQSFACKDMEIIYDELYYGCENNQWYAKVDHIGSHGMEYSLTLLPEGTLLLRNYWEQEGFRTAAHDWYTRTSEMDPYTSAISQGGRLPELREMVDSNWLSDLSYAIDLRDDSVPGDNGGWATVYDVDRNGAYTASYNGSWQYADGLLHLSLVPLGNGYLVDDSFPVLMLDDRLWIARSSSDAGLPHFYTDTMEDLLTQPKG